MGIYLDYNASAPIDEVVLETMIDVYRNHVGNADSRTHDYGDQAREIVENARKQVASLLGISSGEVFFTSGATESNNIAIQGLEAYAAQTGKNHIITSSIEHKAVLETVKAMSEKGFEIDIIDPEKSGQIDPNRILSRVKENTLLVSLMHVNNETGIIQPIEKIGQALCERKVLFHIDATQSCGKLVDELRKVYGLDLERFENKKGYPHGIYPTFTLKQEYFKDFYQEEESSCVELKEKDKPVLLIIKNVSLFFDRLITKLISLGFKKEEIIIMPVKYVNIHTNFISPREPYELFLKDVSYFNQSEIRIVLNLDNVDAMNRIEKTNGIIDLDCYMGDISYISDYYFKDMVMQLKGNQFLYSLPKEKEYSFSELGREFFIGTILQILENELPQRHFKDYEEMKEFIKPLSRELEKRFDMSFDLEKKMFYKISTKEYYNITLKKD